MTEYKYYGKDENPGQSFPIIIVILFYTMKTYDLLVSTQYTEMYIKVVLFKINVILDQVSS